jgi:hypothetical protein
MKDRIPQEKDSTAKPAVDDDAAHGGGKPGRIGEAQVAPEHDPAQEKSGRREFGRDG